MPIETWMRAKWRAYARSWLSDYKYFLLIASHLESTPEARVCKLDAQDLQQALDNDDFSNVCENWPLYWYHLHRLGEKTLIL